MRPFLFAILILAVTMTASASSLPDWVRRSSNAVRVQIHFDDSKECKARLLVADCTPVVDALMCFNVLSDCMPNPGRTSSKLLKLN
jgi:hypothetical protein